MTEDESVFQYLFSVDFQHRRKYQFSRILKTSFCSEVLLQQVCSAKFQAKMALNKRVCKTDLVSCHCEMGRINYICEAPLLSFLPPLRTEKSGGQIFRSKSPLAVPSTTVKIFTQKYSARHRAGVVIGKKCNHSFTKKPFNKGLWTANSQNDMGARYFAAANARSFRSMSVEHFSIRTHEKITMNCLITFFSPSNILPNTNVSANSTTTSAQLIRSICSNSGMPYMPQYVPRQKKSNACVCTNKTPGTSAKNGTQTSARKPAGNFLMRHLRIGERANKIKRSRTNQNCTANSGRLDGMFCSPGSIFSAL